jgi:hypothetical protein
MCLFVTNIMDKFILELDIMHAYYKAVVLKSHVLQLAQEYT